MKILFVGDNRCRANFGCRGTSIALKDIVEKHNVIISTIYGNVTEQYTPTLYKGSIRIHLPWYTRGWQKLRNKIKPINYKDEADFISVNVSESVNNFYAIYKKYAPLAQIMHSIEECDAVIANGEGGFLFRSIYPYESYFEMFIFSLAQSLGKKTYLLNAMFSDGSYSERNEQAIEQARSVLTKCTLVTARDELSREYYVKYIGDNVLYMPDALFSFSKYSKYFELPQQFPLAGVSFPDEEILWKDFDFSKPYIVISAGSRNFRPFVEDDKNSYLELVKRLKINHRCVLLSTSEAESNMLREIAELTDSKFVDCRTNLLYGMGLLAKAQCYVSGRWHPSILASIGGTPCVMLESNSHKSRAIYTELGYNEDAILYHNPPSDTEIEEIVERVDWTIKNISREKILKSVQDKNALLTKYAELLR